MTSGEMSLRTDETWHRLLNWTAGQTPSERLAAQLVQSVGYHDVDPAHPLGGKDGGVDGLLLRGEDRYGMAVYFPRGQKTFGALKQKVIADACGAHAEGLRGVVFVTNQEVTKGNRKLLANAIETELDLIHLERIVAILDQPALHGVREQYLQIPVPGDGDGLSPSERLLELARSSKARCVARWMSAGLPSSQASLLAESDLGSASESLHPSEDRLVVVWQAPMGAGKSIAAERLHQADISAAIRDHSVPVPVWLTASQAAEGLVSAVLEQAAGLWDPRRAGARIVIDGVDEAGYQVADQLLEEARIVTRTWPTTTVVLTSRPLAQWAAAEEAQELPALDEDAQRACIAIASGNDVGSIGLTRFAAPIRRMLERPLFALLAGAWARDLSTRPRTPVDLLAEMGRRAADAAGLDQKVLRQLAVASVRNELELSLRLTLFLRKTCRT